MARQTIVANKVIERAEPTSLGDRFRPSVGQRASDLVPEVGWARLTADDDPRLTLLCELGSGVPAITQGYGGWDEIDRSQNVSLTTWRGYKPIAIDLPLWLDDFEHEASVEGAIDILEALAGRGRKRTPGRPPRVIVHTAGVMPHDAQSFPDLRWVINDLDWDDEQALTNEHGNRVRAPVTVSLLQHVDDARLQDRALAVSERVRAQQKGKAARRRHTVKAGETLVSIARTEFGDPGRWLEIAKANGLRDPRAIRQGAVLKIPS